VVVQEKGEPSLPGEVLVVVQVRGEPLTPKNAKIPLIALITRTRKERIPWTLNKANGSAPNTTRPIVTKWQRRPAADPNPLTDDHQKRKNRFDRFDPALPNTPTPT